LADGLAQRDGDVLDQVVLQVTEADPVVRGQTAASSYKPAKLENGLRLLVPPFIEMALARGMQALGVRIAKALNRLMQRRGRMFDDHYHSRLLRSPTELVNAIAYVLGNHEHHYGPSRGVDPASERSRSPAPGRERPASPDGFRAGSRTPTPVRPRRACAAR